MVSSIRNILASLVLGTALAATGSLTSAAADEVADAVAAAGKAADEARAAADAANAAGSGAAEKAALDAAKAAQAAAAAAQKALAAARAAAQTAAAKPAAPAAVATAAGGDTPYEGHVKCDGGTCQIDLWLTRGFRAFSQCQVCHGLDANGSSFAPSLVEKLREIDRARFDEVVTKGYKGQIGVMPGWETNPNVMKYMDQLYAYLKARSDKVLPAGKLKRYDR